MRKKEETVEAHLAFILTTLITYVFGVLFVVFEAMNSTENLLKITLDNFVPTTITYVLGCVLVNIAEFLQENEKNHYIYNILTCFFVIVYAIIFTIYLSTGYTKLWFIFEIVITAALLYFNVRCYQEKFKNRNHGLV